MTKNFPVKAKKHLGQHFLADENIAKKIVSIFEENYVGSNVLEVGPGTGVLTKYVLLNEKYNYSSCEIDRESIEFLEKNFEGIKIYNEDFLKFDLKKYSEQGVGVIGNFPYNISSQIVFHILENSESVPFMLGMFQKEMAERIAAKHGGKDYGIISILTQAQYNVQLYFTVNEQVFIPPPKVKSAVIGIKRKEKTEVINTKILRKIVKDCFNNRRKMIRNTFPYDKTLLEEKFQNILTKRPEELSVSEWIEISNYITENI